MKPNTLFLMFTFCIPTLGFAAGEPAQGASPSNELNAAMAIKGDPVLGKTAFEICRGCHKGDGAGRADAEYPSLAGQHASVLIKQMADVRSGKRENQKMHPFVAKDVVSTEEIAHIAAYLSGLPASTVHGKGDGKRLAQGKMLYNKDCASCHGTKGEGDAVKLVPRLSAQHYSYLLRQNRAIQSATGKHRDADPAMVKALKGYSYKDIAAVSDYISRL